MKPHHGAYSHADAWHPNSLLGSVIIKTFYLAHKKNILIYLEYFEDGRCICA